MPPQLAKEIVARYVAGGPAGAATGVSDERVLRLLRARTLSCGRACLKRSLMQVSCGRTVGSGWAEMVSGTLAARVPRWQSGRGRTVGTLGNTRRVSRETTQ